MDLAPRRASLDEIYGPLSGDLTLHLYTGHIDAGGAEISGNGYAPGTIPDTGWEPADTDGIKRPTALVDSGTPTAAWSASGTGPPDTITHYVLRDASGDSWGCYRWQSQLTVGSAGGPVLMQPAPYFGENDN